VWSGVGETTTGVVRVTENQEKSWKWKSRKFFIFIHAGYIVCFGVLFFSINTTSSHFFMHVFHNIWFKVIERS